MARILVLGSTGMLGSAVLAVLRDAGLDVAGAQRRPQAGGYTFDAGQPETMDWLKQPELGIDTIINCVGVGRLGNKSSRADAELSTVNAVFPRLLQEATADSGARVIHMSSDGVFAGRSAPYYEDTPADAHDAYGQSKRLGEIEAPNFLSVRCSIIGSDPDRRGYLLDWFLSHERGATVTGFIDHIWDGVTTLQFARLCREIIEKDRFMAIRERTPVLHFSPNQPVSKYDLLCLFDRVFASGIRVVPGESERPVTRILESYYRDLLRCCGMRQPLEEAIRELRDFMDSRVPHPGATR
ncbi:MAG: sugar nucleotide-binding protein [Alphaproteobacteria bacterium]|nr:sugar nucleotide-binding protein [Alphaproteobacteria bacterium]